MSRLRQLTVCAEVDVGDLKKMLNPKTVALLGASDKEKSVGQVLMKNLVSSGDHRTFPVNPRARSIQGLSCFPAITDISEHIDLAIVATPAPTVPQLVNACGKKGVEGLIIISRGFRETGDEGKRLAEEISSLRQYYGMRILGPNSLGLIRPSVGLNACLLPTMPEAGNIAFLSGSGALGSALLDWAANRQIGLSMFVAIGSMIDVDFGDLIDYAGDDPETRSILLFMERVGNARRFVGAVRAFSRNKPIIIMKPRRVAGHEMDILGASWLEGEDAVYEAVFERAGAVRVDEVSELFNAATVLDSRVLPRGPSLAIITNSRALGRIATGNLISQGGLLATLSSDSLALLGAELPLFAGHENPVHIPDSDKNRYEMATKVCMVDPAVDAVLLIYAYLGSPHSLEVSEVIITVAKKALKPIIVVWIGGEHVKAARQLCSENDIPSYETPEEAIKTYVYMYCYRRNLDLQYETPEELSVDLSPPKNHLRTLVRRAIREGRSVLREEESQDFLATYGISIVPAFIVNSVSAAISRAQDVGYPVLLKADSGVGDQNEEKGLILEAYGPDDLRGAYLRIVDNAKKHYPHDQVSGVRIQKKVIPIDYELLLGSRTDKAFGSVIIFGSGGMVGRMTDDWSIGIPPLNQTLTRRLIEKTKVYRILDGSMGKQPVSRGALERVILNLSNLIVDFPEIASIDINPLTISEGQPFALNARLILREDHLVYTRQYPHLVITPYPTRYVSAWRMKDGTEAMLRPIKPEDEALLQDMLNHLSEQSMRARFFTVVRSISHEMLVRLCNVDYDRHMAITAEIKDNSKIRFVGIARLIAESDGRSAEFAVVVSDDHQRKGLGYKLIDAIIGIGQDWGLDEIYGEVLAENEKMLGVTRRLGFDRHWLGGGIVRVVLKLK